MVGFKTMRTVGLGKAPTKAWLKVAAIAALLCWRGPSCDATVIITLYHQGAVYVGSDSLVVNGTNKFYHPKIFQVSPTCCSAIGRCYGGFIPTGRPGKHTPIYLPLEIQKLCNDNFQTVEPLAEKTKKILS